MKNKVGITIISGKTFTAEKICYRFSFHCRKDPFENRPLRGVFLFLQLSAMYSFLDKHIFFRYNESMSNKFNNIRLLNKGLA